MARTTRPEAVKTLAEQVRGRAGSSEQNRVEPSAKYDGKVLVSSGVTVLNLACSDHPDWAFPAGSVINIVGDKSTGKTLLALTMLAEACTNPSLAKHDLKYDDTEAALKFDLEAIFGRKLCDRLGEFEDPSDSVEEFSKTLRTCVNDGPTMYVLDSFDEIGSEDEKLHVEKADKAREAGEKAKGTYGMGRAKSMSQLFRLGKRDLTKNGSVLVVISQVRENLDRTGPWSPKFHRAGGKALDHNADLVIWLNRTKTHKHEATKREIGYRLEALVDKNKVTGKRRSASFDVWHQYGADDIGSMIDFMVEAGKWSSRGGIVEGFGEKLQRTKMVKLLEEYPDRLRKLRQIVGEAWNEIEDRIKPQRARRWE